MSRFAGRVPARAVPAPSIDCPEGAAYGPCVKPGELERNLSRLVEATRAAREKLAAMEHDLAELRLEMERLAAEAPEAPPTRRPEPERPELMDDEAHGLSRRDRAEPAARTGSDQPGREASSE